MNLAQQTAQRISSAPNILIICHVAPDGDAIGSLLGLGLTLEQHGHQITMACADPVPTACRHLPCWERIVQSVAGPAPDLVISLDCSDIERLGKAFDPARLAGIPIVNIDHHVTNIQFGEINWIDTRAAATAQMLVELLNAMRIEPDVEVATCLLNGILTDTLGFRTYGTTAETMDAARQLTRAGASIGTLSDRIFNHRSMNVIKMWSAAMQEMHLDGRILWSQITRDMRQRLHYEENGDGGLVSFLCAIDEVDIAIIFDELNDGSINVSMRASPGYNVSQVALALGGGGHPQAAGCTIPGPLATVQEQVLTMLKQVWNEQRQNR